MTIAHILGFPRIGKQRELKKAVEAYWAKEISQQELLAKGKDIRANNWHLQKQHNLDFVTVGDFSWYDHMLDMSTMFGLLPERFNSPANNNEIDLDTYFRMARGRAPTGQDAPACEMTKWFDTNYHYIVPELSAKQAFRLARFDLFEQTKEAQELGYNPKPVIVGPLTFLWLSKCKGTDFDKLSLLDNLIVIYGQLLTKLQAMGVEWCQIDEPILCLDLPQAWQDAFESAYTRLRVPDIKIMLASYFGGLDEHARMVTQLPVEGIHVDLVRDPDQLIRIVDKLPNYKILSAGIVNGRNVWRTDLSACLEKLVPVAERLKDRLWISSSCSLLHSPVDLAEETSLNADIKSWMAFAVQKLGEISTIAKAITDGKESCKQAFIDNDKFIASRKSSPLIHKPAVQERMKNLSRNMFNRSNDYKVRAQSQRASLNLPSLPTTTIGSFPQTKEIRLIRKSYKSGDIDAKQYEDRIKEQIKETVRFQEEIGLDVLVHGEAERNDMVEYFGELLDGFTFTKNGWVQSYGSRCVKPPVIYGDVHRPKAMTVEWTKYAQSITKSPMKGMLTGPGTILSWSFVRDDQPRKDTAQQIALALRDEIIDLESAGISIIQIDEPAFREGLPLKQINWPAYLEWAVDVFKLAVSGVKDETQIHTHMCYSEFNDVIESIAALDADVITIESSRSQMELLKAFKTFNYPNEIGPGIYDIHSPRVPSEQEMVDLLAKAAEVIPFGRLWVNPDCGLKTRAWEETKQALVNMVKAAKTARVKFAEKQTVA